MNHTQISRWADFDGPNQRRLDVEHLTLKTASLPAWLWSLLFVAAIIGYCIAAMRGRGL